MKKFTILLLSMAFIRGTALSQSCLPEGITFTTQEEIDNFQNNYPGCMEIEGDVTISGNSITSLNGLNVLASIGGTLRIGINNGGNTILTNLTGLENLISIVGNLNIGGQSSWGYIYNPVLTSLTGLEGLTSVGGNLSILANYSLLNLSGINNLSSIGGNILIFNNANLTSCGAQSICDYLTSPIGIVDIFNNGTGCNTQTEVASDCGGPIPCLPHGNYYFLTQTDIDNFQINFPGCIELEGKITIHGDTITNLAGLNQVLSIIGNLEIMNCSGLTSLAGLENLINIGGDLKINDNNTMASLTGLSSLSSIGGNLNLLYNDVLVNFSGLENLQSIGGSMGVHENNQLLSMSGLENLDSIGGQLGIGTSYNVGDPPPPGGNHLLVNLNPLENLTFVGDGIDIGRNASLLSLAGIENIDPNTITFLMIGYNPSLSTCEVKSVCDYLANPNGNIFVDGNAPGCDTRQQVEDACNGVSIAEVSGQRSAVSSYPNPFSDFITLEYEIEHSSNVNLSIYNHLGQRVVMLVDGKQAAGRQKVKWNAEGQPAGIYFYRLTIDDYWQATGKMIVVK